jgi:catechol 1,2-dioxygenase
MAEFNERVAQIGPDILQAIEEQLVKHQVSHSEYRAAWKWLMGLAGSGEVPLFLDVFFESVVERSTFDGKPGSQGSVEGPYHLADAPELTEKPHVLPMRDDEPGEPMVFSGRVLDLDGRPLAGALVDTWQAGNDGTYSGFVGDHVPRTNLRGQVRTDADGTFQFRTIRPAPYQIPNSGPTGEFLEMIGRHSWRPAHFHFIVSADGHDSLTTQLYFNGGKWLDGDGDVVNAVKDSLLIDVSPSEDTGTAATYGIGTPFQTAEYDFVLRPAG